MKKTNSTGTREHILKVAEEIFASKGFNGARVDEIAKQAKVNKALIYYYFKSKRAILDELFENFISTANSFLVEMAVRKPEFGSEEMMDLMGKYNQFFYDNSKILKVMMAESLNDSYQIPPLFRLIDFSGEGMTESETIAEMNKLGFNLDEDPNQRRVTEFFTGIMPTVLFSIFQEKWCSHFKINSDELYSLFQKAEDMTHGEHHKKGN